MEGGISAQPGPHGASPHPAASRLGERPEPLRSGGFQLSDLLWPREHGAWGMVSLPFITAAIVGGGWASLATLAAALATLSIFMLRTPLAALWRIEVNAQRQPPAGNRKSTPTSAANSKDAERRNALISLFIYGAAASVAGGFLLWTLPPMPLIVMGCGAVVLTVATLFLVVRNYQRYPALQIASAAGLTASSLPAYLAAHGHLDRVAFCIWALFAAHSSASVLVVHAQLESVVAARKKAAAETERPHRRNAWIAQVSLWLALAIIAIAGRPWLIVPFLPACLLHGWNLWRLGAEKPGRISMTRVGLSNLGASIVFCLLLVFLLKAGWVILP
jgi:YwiC-like protein